MIPVTDDAQDQPIALLQRIAGKRLIGSALQKLQQRSLAGCPIVPDHRKRHRDGPLDKGGGYDHCFARHFKAAAVAVYRRRNRTVICICFVTVRLPS